MELKLRKATEEDKKIILQLLKENMEDKFIDNFGGFSNEVSEKQYDKIEKIGFNYVIEDENIIGFFSFYEEPNEHKSYILNNIQIKKEYQSKGIGSKALTFVEDKVKELKGNKIKLLVFKNNPAYEFYKKRDYKEIEFLDKSKTCVMVKEI